MARPFTKCIKLNDGNYMEMHCAYMPDYERLNTLSMAVDDGDFSKLDELIDLIVYERECSAYYDYINLAADRGNIKAEYVVASRLPTTSIKRLRLMKNLADRGYEEASCDYERTKVWVKDDIKWTVITWCIIIMFVAAVVKLTTWIWMLS